MSKAQAAADRVEEFLRRHSELVAEHHTIEITAGPETLQLRVDDLVALVESAHWLALAGTGGIHREYCEATREPISDNDARMITREPTHAAANVAEWNSTVCAPEFRNTPRAFVAQRLVSDWERKA